MNFSDLKLSESLLKTIENLKFTECTPIQEQSIPLIIDGKDVAGLAQTGTGKTAAYLLPLMDRILRSAPSQVELAPEVQELNKLRAFPDWKPFHYVLVLVPTRELAEQVMQNVQTFGADSGMAGCAIYGGTSYDKQKECIKRGVQFVIATPGRLIDLYKEHVIDLKLVRAIVFDEADRMFDMGFKDDMKYILSRVPNDRQFMVFSATLNFDVLNTAYQFGSNPVEVSVGRDQVKAENVKDEIYHCGNDEKPQYLLSILKLHNPKQVIVFSNFKNQIDRIVKLLNDNQIPAMGISSLITQAQRNRVIEQFKAENEHNILVATDVAARGLDIKGVDLVINFDLPGDSESYVHRIGRTGRAGQEGRAVSFVSDRDVDALSRIEDYLKHKVNVGWLEDAQLLKDFKPMGREFEGGYRSHQGGGDRRDRPQRGGDRGGRRPGPRRHEGKSRGESRGPFVATNAPGGSPPEKANGAQGRHPHKNEGREFKPRHPKSADHQHGKSSEQRPPRHQSKHHDRPKHGKRPSHHHEHKKAPMAAKSSVIQKVTKFFKGLFD